MAPVWGNQFLLTKEKEGKGKGSFYSDSEEESDEDESSEEDDEEESGDDNEDAEESSEEEEEEEEEEDEEEDEEEEESGEGLFNLKNENKHLNWLKYWSRKNFIRCY